eukprot:gene3987-2839_t
MNADGDVQGYWWWTWPESQAAPKNTNMGIAFSGWADVNNAIGESAPLYSKLPGAKIFTIGGGNSNGHFTKSSIEALNSALSSGKLDGYAGISYDIEEGDGGLTNTFQESFTLAKKLGKKVMVTVSHSAPYGIPDGASMMRSFLSDTNIDYISPQLYTTGEEASNEFSTEKGVQWSEYAQAKAAIVPSIVRGSYYADAKSRFASYGVATKGYIQWEQV